MSTQEFAVKGLAELQQRLLTLPSRLQQRALTNAIRAGARVVQEEIREKAPVRTGAIRRNVDIGRRRAPEDGHAVTFVVGVRHGKPKTTPVQYVTKRGKTRTRRLTAYDRRVEDPYYFRWQEGGFHAVGRHRAANRAERRARQAGRPTFGRHIAGRRFMRGGLETAAPRALEAIRAKLAAELERLS